MLADLRNPDRNQLEALVLHIEGLASSGVKKNILDWAEANVLFPHSDRATTFKRSFAPWLNMPLTEFASGRWRVISFVGPTGMGKTTLLEIITAFCIAQDPGPILILGQSDDDISDWAEDRLMPMLDQMPATRALMPQNRYARRKTEIIFPHLPLRLGGANLNTTQSRSVRYVFGDELWRWKGGMLEEARARLHDRANGVLLCMGQGGVRGDEHQRIHETCQEYEYSWQCPNCSNFNAYSTDPAQLRYDDARDEKGPGIGPLSSPPCVCGARTARRSSGIANIIAAVSPRAEPISRPGR